ncbi:hypothetical protein SAMN04489812_2416 [Microlunatus soli]|uniref:Uncharacterized protein n=1 Tax=Microlunatus soli TaxID=630515 RepID=A0A1H1TJX4_9ACTN|nr:hypothetical protein SAMN04489812_2416 [Microlunatus soli]
MGAIIKRLLQVLWRTVLAEAIRRSMTALCRKHRRR